MQATIHPTITRYFTALSNLDRGAFLACFASPCEHHDPVGGPVRTNSEELGQFFDQVGGLFAQVSIGPDKVFPGGDEVALTWSARGQGKNGRQVTFEGIDVFRLDAQGQIASLKAWWDMGPTLAELMA